MQNGWNLDFDFIMNEQETPANSKISPARGKLMLLVHYDTSQYSTLSFIQKLYYWENNKLASLFYDTKTDKVLWKIDIIIETIDGNESTGII